MPSNRFILLYPASCAIDFTHAQSLLYLLYIDLGGCRGYYLILITPGIGINGRKSYELLILSLGFLNARPRTLKPNTRMIAEHKPGHSVTGLPLSDQSHRQRIPLSPHTYVRTTYA